MFSWSLRTIKKFLFFGITMHGADYMKNKLDVRGQRVNQMSLWLAAKISTKHNHTIVQVFTCGCAFTKAL